MEIRYFEIISLTTLEAFSFLIISELYSLINSHAKAQNVNLVFISLLCHGQSSCEHSSCDKISSCEVQFCSSVWI